MLRPGTLVAQTVHYLNVLSYLLTQYTRDKYLRSTSHHLDWSDLLKHGNTSGRCTRAGRKQIVVSTNHNGRKLPLNTLHHDDDEHTKWHAMQIY